MNLKEHRAHSLCQTQAYAKGLEEGVVSAFDYLEEADFDAAARMDKEDLFQAEADLALAKALLDRTVEIYQSGTFVSNRWDALVKSIEGLLSGERDE